MIFLPGLCLFPSDLLCFAGSGLWRSSSIFGMLQLGSVGDSQLGGAGGVKDGRMDGRWFFHRATQRKKLSVFPSQSPQRSQTSTLCLQFL